MCLFLIKVCDSLMLRSSGASNCKFSCFIDVVVVHCFLSTTSCMIFFLFRRIQLFSLISFLFPAFFLFSYFLFLLILIHGVKCFVVFFFFRWFASRLNEHDSLMLRVSGASTLELSCFIEGVVVHCFLSTTSSILFSTYPFNIFV